MHDRWGYRLDTCYRVSGLTGWGAGHQVTETKEATGGRIICEGLVKGPLVCYFHLRVCGVRGKRNEDDGV